MENQKTAILEASPETQRQYDEQIAKCRDIFIRKSRDYGTSWQVLRLSSLTDQILIKARRLRNLEEHGHQMVDDGKDIEYIGIVNYSIIGLIRMELDDPENALLDEEKLVALYDTIAGRARELMLKKNHDYGEAWRLMYISSLTDLILMKLFRMRQLIENRGKPAASEGLDANLYDIINYSVFALIRLNENYAE